MHAYGRVGVRAHNGSADRTRTIGVIGSFVSDLIEPYGGPPTRSLGGIYYTLTYLATVFERGWVIRPLAMVGSDIFDQVCARLAVHRHIDLSLLRREERSNTQVRLTYVTENERQEMTTEPMTPLPWEAVQELLGCDVILVNFITGAELTPECFSRLSQEASGLIYEDYHSLAWARDAQGRRFLRKNPHWRKWLTCADVTQMNEHEASSLLGHELPLSDGALEELAHQVLQGRGKILLVTKAEKGAFVAEKTSNGLRTRSVPAVRVERVVDPTGCGDAFATGFLHCYLETGDAHRAVCFANKVAAINCTLLGAENAQAIAVGLERLRAESTNYGNERSTAR